MRFIVANYGPRQAGMLLVFLHSVRTSHPAARVTVYHQDIPERLLAAMQTITPHADWVRTAFDFDRDPVQRISSKVLCWARGAEDHAGEARLVFCDSDTLVRRDLSGFFNETTADVIFTTKPENVPLNSGVMLACGRAAATAFFRCWRDETLAILRDPQRYAQANDPKLPYGGADQMSLHKMLHYERAVETYQLDCDGQNVMLQAMPCALLNETNSRRLCDTIHVIHYKAGWQRILLDGRPFSRFRPRRESWQMLTLFLETFALALREVEAAGGGRFTAADFGVRWPWYYLSGGGFSPAGYAAWRLREAGKRAALLLTGRLKPGM